MVELGGARTVVRIAKDAVSDNQTLVLCAAILNELSQDGVSRERLVADGAVPALINLSNIQDKEVLNPPKTHAWIH